MGRTRNGSDNENPYASRRDATPSPAQMEAINGLKAALGTNEDEENPTDYDPTLGDVPLVTLRDDCQPLGNAGPLYLDTSHREPLQIPSAPVKRTVQTLKLGSLSLQPFFANFYAHWGREGLITLEKVLGVPQLAPYMLAPFIVSASMQMTANLFSVTTTNEEAEDADNRARQSEGMVRASLAYLRYHLTAVRGQVTLGVPALGMMIAFPAAMWPLIEPIKQWMDEQLGIYQWIPISLMTSIGCSYLIFTRSEAVMNATRFWLDDPSLRLEPPQQTLFQQFLDGHCASAVQCATQYVITLLVQASYISFFALRFAEETGHSNIANVVKDVAFVAALAATDTGPVVYNTYFGGLGHRLDLVTEEDRQVVSHRMTYGQLFAREILMLISPRAVGQRALGGMVGYALGESLQASLGAMIDEMLGTGMTLQTMLPWIFAGLVSLITYAFIFRQAEVKRQLNEAAVDNAKSHLIAQIRMYPNMLNRMGEVGAEHCIKHAEDLLGIEESKRFKPAPAPYIVPAYVDHFDLADEETKTNTFIKGISYAGAITGWVATGAMGIAAAQHVFANGFFSEKTVVLAASFANLTVAQDEIPQTAARLSKQLPKLAAHAKTVWASARHCLFTRAPAVQTPERAEAEIRNSLLSQV